MFIILAPLIKQNKSLIISDLYGSGTGKIITLCFLGFLTTPKTALTHLFSNIFAPFSFFAYICDNLKVCRKVCRPNPSENTDTEP